MTAPPRDQDEKVLTVLMIPAGSGEESRTFRFPYPRLRAWGWTAAAALALTAVMAGSWWYFAARSLRVGRLEAEVAQYRDDGARLTALASRLEELEARYGRMRGLFGTEEADLPSSLWLPPAPGGSDASDREGDQARPSSWPLTERGFVTQGLLEGGQSHPGIDIAVAQDSYIRASGAGTVAEVGQDEVYGNYVVLEHGQGLRSLYGHASTTLVDLNQEVRRNEVIALSGSTGRSTAPHLHFEVTQDGEPQDPLEWVRQP